MKHKRRGLFIEAGLQGNVPPDPDPVDTTVMMIDIDRISFFKKNPRRAPNEKYEEIKESIRNSGLDNPLPISHHPDDPVGDYIIYKGGNTRLKALKALWEETKDQRFLKVDCRFHPFVSELDAQIAHQRENDVRGEMTFIDKAFSIQSIKEGFEKEAGGELSLRKLEDMFTQRGIPTSIGMMSKFSYAAKLNAFIPTALKSGMGRPQIERLQKLEKAALAVLRFHGDKYATEQQFRDTVFAPALSGGDGESWVYEAAEAAVRLRLLAALPQGTDSESVFASFKLAINGKELAKTPEPPVTTPQAEPELAPAYLPLDQLDLLDTPVAVPAPVMGRGGAPMDGVYVQPPQPIPLPSTDGEIRIEGGGMPLDGELDDDRLEYWMPYASQQTRETVIEGNGRWIDKVKVWRERNHALAVKLSNAYVPHGELSIEQLNIGYGFIFNNVYNPSYLLQLNDRADEDIEAVDAIMHIGNLWWFLAEASGMYPDPDYPKITCPPDVLSQLIPSDSHLYDQKALEGFAPVPIASVRLRTWWLKLTDKQLEMVFELVRNIRAINDMLLEHAKETGNASAWEITTE